MDQHPGAVGRRALIGAGAGVAAASLLPALVGRAAASATPPKQPTDADVTLLAAAQQLELTLRDLYDVAITGITGWTDEEEAVMTFLREAHEEFANSISGALGRGATGERSEPLWAQLRPSARGTTADVLVAMWGVESAAVATHGDLLGQLAGTNGAALAASIQIAEARHCTVLADLAGITDPSLLLVDTEQPALEVTA